MKMSGSICDFTEFVLKQDIVTFSKLDNIQLQIHMATYILYEIALSCATFKQLTHYCLMSPYGFIQLDQHCLTASNHDVN